MYARLPPRFLGWALVLGGLSVVAALVSVSWQALPLSVALGPLVLGAALVGLGLLVLGEYPRHRSVAVRVTAAGLVVLGLAALVIRAGV